MNNLKALIKTKSNFRNLNGQWLIVKQFLGKLVVCVDQNGTTIDFSLSEIEEIRPLIKTT